MTRVLVATYEDGLLKLDEPLELADSTRVRIHIEIPGALDSSTAADASKGAENFIGFIEDGPEDEPLARDHDRYLYEK